MPPREETDPLLSAISQLVLLLPLTPNASEAEPDLSVHEL